LEGENSLTENCDPISRLQCLGKEFEGVAVSYDQGDQIGQFFADWPIFSPIGRLFAYFEHFADWAIVYFGRFFADWAIFPRLGDCLLWASLPIGQLLTLDNFSPIGQLFTLGDLSPIGRLFTYFG
jgi:hypothetical protein